jgi:hypothetical protein
MQKAVCVGLAASECLAAARRFEISYPMSANGVPLTGRVFVVITGTFGRLGVPFLSRDLGLGNLALRESTVIGGLENQATARKGWANMPRRICPPAPSPTGGRE